MEWDKFKKEFETNDKDELKTKIDNFIKILNKEGTRDLAEKYNISREPIRRFAKSLNLKYSRSNSTWYLDKENNNKKEQEKNNKQEKGKCVGVKKGVSEEKYETIDKGDYWIITDGEDRFPITKAKYSAIRKDYCDPKGRKSRYLKIPEICRKYNIRRKHFIMLKNAFGFIHDDIEYTDEEIAKDGIDALVEDHLERDKNEYFKKLNDREINKIIKENEAYRKKDYYINKIHDMVSSHFLEFAQNYKPVKLPKKPKVNNSNRLLELSIVDLHLAKLSWSPETGENYDRHIAEERFMYVINDVLEEVQNMPLKKIIFPIGNDFFNFDNIKGSTSKGTPQHNDSRWQKMYLFGQELLIKAIDMLRQLAPVTVFVVPGNHDWLTSFHAIVNMNSWYRNDDDVTVNTNPRSRKYVRFGNTLLGFTHLDKEKKRIYGCMQVEAKKDWGETKYHEWHGAHLHKELVKDDMGVVVRNLSCVSARDEWHYNNGYLPHPHNQAFIWDYNKGLKYIINTELNLGDEYEIGDSRITL